MCDADKNNCPCPRAHLLYIVLLCSIFTQWLMMPIRGVVLSNLDPVSRYIRAPHRSSRSYRSKIITLHGYYKAYIAYPSSAVSRSTLRVMTLSQPILINLPSACQKCRPASCSRILPNSSATSSLTSSLG